MLFLLGNRRLNGLGRKLSYQ